MASNATGVLRPVCACVTGIAKTIGVPNALSIWLIINLGMRVVKNYKNELEFYL